jgi:hypothetical protein
MSLEVDPASVEEWLKSKAYPDRTWGERRDRTWEHEIYHFTDMRTLFDCLEAAKTDSGVGRNVLKVKGPNGLEKYWIEYAVSDVHVIEPCKDGHDFGEWRYDFTGGDIRECNICGLHEFT